MLAETRGVVSYDRDARSVRKRRDTENSFFISSVSIKTLPRRVAPSRRRRRALAPDAPRGFVPGVPASPRPPRGRGRGRPRDRGRGQGVEVPVVLRASRDGHGDGDAIGRRREGNRRRVGFREREAVWRERVSLSRRFRKRRRLVGDEIRIARQGSASSHARRGRHDVVVAVRECVTRNGSSRRRLRRLRRERRRRRRALRLSAARPPLAVRPDRFPFRLPFFKRSRGKNLTRGVSLE